MDTLTLGLGVLGFIVNILVLAIAGTYQLSSVEVSIRETLAKHREDMDDEIAELRQDVTDQIVNERRDVGETMIAIRQKINDVELYVRDTYVERSTFTQIISSLSNELKLLGDRVETRMIRLESKMDQVISGQHND